MAGGDADLTRSIEALFQQAGFDTPDSIDGIISALQSIAVAPQHGTQARSALGNLKGEIHGLLDGKFKFVSDLYDFPAADGGIIYLEDDVTYCVTDSIDLAGSRIVAGANNGIIGSNQHVARITSTGLVSTPVLTGTKKIVLRDIDFHDLDECLNLIADDPSDFLVWTRVGFTDCSAIGLISGYNSFTIEFSSISASANLTFDGNLGTVSMSDMFILGIDGQSTIIISDSATISRRFRIRYATIITTTGATGLEVSPLASIPGESYILIDCNFSGSGAPTSGVTYEDNKVEWLLNKGITNSRIFAQYYMTGNATATPVSVGVPAKILGSTTENPINQRFSHTDNRATYVGVGSRDFKVDIIAALSAGNNNVLRLYVAKNGTAITQVYGEGTSNAGGRAEGIMTAGIVELSTGDYVEAFVSNESGSSDITGINLNLLIDIA